MTRRADGENSQRFAIASSTSAARWLANEKGNSVSDATRLRILQPILALFGLIAIALLAARQTVAIGVAWHDMGDRSPYFEMICAISVVLGIFLLIASRNPAEHRSLIWFTVWSSVAHGGLMFSPIHSTTIRTTWRTYGAMFRCCCSAPLRSPC